MIADLQLPISIDIVLPSFSWLDAESTTLTKQLSISEDGGTDASKNAFSP